ncbi:MAG: glycosyltransferase [Desulfarculaceae bacterium]|nr:glycosyltransferase [Desulfarculaceae bacterium]MCF8072768.1 glycosyltransferase [Desulfarculaceae bacterium]MCF8100936.1 glycosyltransferase [Desulfarculaceae bacterium]MCF8117580.1 glycosyltransferase [Desulfarculaceae bacterium]
MPGLAGARVVLVHDWLTGMRGGEKVLEALCRLFPEAPLYTLLHLPGSVSPLIENRPIHTSFVQKMPFAARRYRHYLPLFPRAMERLAMPPCDLVLSTSHCVAKAASPPPGAMHVSYLHTPMRYVWDMYPEYFGPGRGGAARYVMPLLRRGMQRWDVATCGRVDHFIANSRHVARRIRRNYGRGAEVIPPPVEAGRFAPTAQVQGYYLVVSALVPYKRVDLAVEACTKARKRLKVVGRGPEEARLKAMAGPTVEFLGWVGDEHLADLYARAKAFLFPGEEDFGITPLESMASGRPVIAYARGGALETVVGLDDSQGRAPTGLFFHQQDAEALRAAMDQLEDALERFDAQELAGHAAGFDTARFMERMAAHLEDLASGRGVASGGGQ